MVSTHISRLLVWVIGVEAYEGTTNVTWPVRPRQPVSLHVKELGIALRKMHLDVQTIRKVGRGLSPLVFFMLKQLFCARLKTRRCD